MTAGRLAWWGPLIIAACTAATPPAADPSPVPTSALSAPAVAPARDPAPVVAPPPTPPRPELLALAEARKKFRARDYAGAWLLLEPIAKAVQSDGGLQCEAGYLAHHAGNAGQAEALLRRGIVILARDNTRPGRHRRAMCLYNLALVQEAGGALGEAICSLRRSEALRSNATVTRKRKQLTAQIAAADFRCQTGRVARQRDVRALASEYASANDLKITSLERTDAGEFVVHTVHLDPGERDPGDVELFTDVCYVVLDRGGQLFPLGVLGYEDETPSYFRGGASFSFVGFRPSPLGTLVLFSLESWGRGDTEHVKSSNDIANHERKDLLVCRFVAAGSPEPGGDVACAQVPLRVSETADAEDFDDDATGSDTGAATGDDSDGGAAGPRVTDWGASVDYTLDEAAGEFVFERQRGDADTATTLGLPVGRVPVAELFEQYAAEVVGLDI